MINVLAAAVKSTAWQGADGIITEGSSTSSNNDGVGFKGTYDLSTSITQANVKCHSRSASYLHPRDLRSLYTKPFRYKLMLFDSQLHRRPSKASSVKFVFLFNILFYQYNALLDLAANGTSYSADWHGPPQAFTIWGQLAALDVLTSAILANN
jgi:hypothetical protein